MSNNEQTLFQWITSKNTCILKTTSYKNWLNVNDESDYVCNYEYDFKHLFKSFVILN